LQRIFPQVVLAEEADVCGVIFIVPAGEYDGVMHHKKKIDGAVRWSKGKFPLQHILGSVIQQASAIIAFHLCYQQY